MSHPRFRRSIATAETSLAPTPERYQHGEIERLERPVVDDRGAITRPHRVVDTLLAMERRGSITAAMRHAAQDFRSEFATAQLDPLRAVNWSRPTSGGAMRQHEHGIGWRIEKAREFVWQTIRAVGGPGSPGGSCLWHVLGWERSLKEWALEQGWSGRRVSQETASGILIAVLGMLETHCRAHRSLRSQ